MITEVCMSPYYMPHKPVLRGIALALALAFASSPYAAGTKSPSDAEFSKMDANEDGKITAEEHAAAARKMFEMMDRNKDGKVTAAEMDAAHAAVTGRKA